MFKAHPPSVLGRYTGYVSCFSLVICWGTTPSSAGEATELSGVCEKPNEFGRFICESYGLAFTDRETVLDTLLCIALYPQTEDPYGEPHGRILRKAVRALFHIAKSDEEIRRYLCEIITKASAQSSAFHAACEFVVYVANDEVQRLLLSELNRRCPEYGSAELRKALVILADPAVCEWMKDLLNLGNQHPAMVRLFERDIHYVQLQHDSEKLLEYLRGDVHDPSRPTLLRYAFRMGVDRQKLHDAVIEHLGRAQK